MRSLKLAWIGSLSAFLATSVLFSAPASAQKWEEVSHEQGIKVWQRPVPGSSLVEFRGHAVINTGLKNILAVLNDSKHKTEWMQNCVENQVLKQIALGKRVVYNRTATGFPLISDRDVVVQTDFTVWTEKRQVKLEAWSVQVKNKPQVEGVVRMNKLLLSWQLTVLGPDKTDVFYQVQADPGGMLPNWLVNLASKKLPHRTLLNLRKQVKKVNGEHKDYMASLATIESAFDWRSVGL